MDIEALRADTPGCAHRVHLNNAGAGLLSRRTLRAMTDHLELEAALGGYEAEAREAERFDAVYTDLAALVGGRPGEVALFDSATRAWGAAFSAMHFAPGDRILTGRAEYGSNALSLLHTARRTGAELVVVPDDESGQVDTAALAGLVDERTRLVALSHVPSSGGLVNPVAEVGRITRAAGVPFLLDATQSVGQFPVDVTRIGCDMLCGTGRKFLRGPRCIGFLWVRTEALDLLEPPLATLKGATWDGGGGLTWSEGARRFETWEISGANVLGLGAAVRQALELGVDRIGRRAAALGARLRDRLAEVPGVAVRDLGRERCAIVTCTVGALPAAEVAAALARHGVNVSVTAPDHTPFDAQRRALPPLVRFSPHYYTTGDEVDRPVDLVAALARRTA